jgi:hypothetical protein
MSDITKPPDDKPGGLTTGGLKGGKLRSSSSPFQQRVSQAAKQEASRVIDAGTMPNRIALLLDCSGSMSDPEQLKDGSSKKRIVLLQDAVSNFIARCNFVDTSVAVKTFPEKVSVLLSCERGYLMTIPFQLNAGGGTPMHSCVSSVLTDIPLTRGIIVSDGQATDWHDSFEPGYDDEPTARSSQDEILFSYKEQGVPIDCVHISLSTSGEELLKRIASITGGIFLKFTDVQAFANAFGFLTPGYRAMLGDGRMTAEQLGAKELKP